MDLIWEWPTKDCIEGCKVAWLDCAQQVLGQNKVHPILFADAMRELLLKVRDITKLRGYPRSNVKTRLEQSNLFLATECYL